MDFDQDVYKPHAMLFPLAVLLASCVSALEQQGGLLKRQECTIRTV